MNMYVCICDEYECIVCVCVYMTEWVSESKFVPQVSYFLAWVWQLSHPYAFFYVSWSQKH